MQLSSRRNIYSTFAHADCSGSASRRVGHFEHRDFRQHPHLLSSAASSNSFGGPDSPYSPGGTLAGGTLVGGGAVFYHARNARLGSAAPSHISVVPDPSVTTYCSMFLQ